jgi:hypothetical protein
MTAIRTAEISGIFTRWLERYSPPAQIRENERAQQDEAQALLGVLLRFAPQTGYADFVALVIDRVEFQMKTRAWPTKGELGAVCSNLRKEGAKPTDITGGPDMSPPAVNARRMQRGEAVAEGWLWGVNACDLIATGLIDEPTMTRYRSAAFMARKAIYGEDAALGWEADAKARHQSAREARRQREAEQRDIAIPDKSVPYSAGDFAA